MRFVVMGSRVGTDEIQPIATISLSADYQLVVDARDPSVRSALIALIEKWLMAGGFFAQVSRYEPSEEQPKTHVSYAIKQKPRDTYFDWALESVVARYWTGELAGNYEIHGFASYVEEGR